MALEKAKIAALELTNIDYVHQVHLMRLINRVQASMLTQMKKRELKRHKIS